MKVVSSPCAFQIHASSVLTSLISADRQVCLASGSWSASCRLPPVRIRPPVLRGPLVELQQHPGSHGYWLAQSRLVACQSTDQQSEQGSKAIRLKSGDLGRLHKIH